MTLESTPDLATGCSAQKTGPPRGLETRLALAGLAGWVAFFAPTQVLLAVAAESMYPADKELFFGLVSAAGSAVMLFAYPLIGALSDRLLRTVDRRTVSMAGVLVAAGCLVMTGHADNGLELTLWWCATQTGIAATQCGVEASVADEIPIEHRARIGGKLAAAQMFAALLGTVAASVSTDLPVSYLIVAGVVTLLAAPFVLTSASRAPKSVPGPPAPTRVHARRSTAELWLGWTSRTLVLFGLGNVTQFLYFFVHDELARPEPASALILLTGLFVLSVVISAVVLGMVSDRVQDRTGPAVIGSAVAGVAASAFGYTQSWPLILCAAVAFGVGLGAFMGPTFALLTELLPDPRHYARDLGLLNTAVVAPSALAPIVGVAVLRLDNGFTVLYTIAGASMLLGSVAMYVLRRRTDTKAAVPQ
ncbi:MFS transporter [Rhodococcus fascians]|nr:MFS transporter [Rhodococcus fascians]MBY4022476.1 MFS transporter [Rhodococcus fascians]